MTEAFSILMIISGSVSAYKSLEVIRLLAKRGIATEAVLTKGGEQFVTPLALSSLTGCKTYTDLFSLTDEVEMGHIQLSRRHQLVVVCPASADILAKMAQGICDDLASTLLLATDKPVYVAPAMNHRMWEHPATQRNVARLRKDGVHFIGPDEGEMACGEYGPGRLAEPLQIADAVERFLEARALPTQNLSLNGRRALVTAGPTYEAIDAVRFLGNYSSGKQGIAIAQALQKAGAEVELILGPVSEPLSQGMKISRVTTAEEMLAACQQALPVDIAVCSAAVADWKPAERHEGKLKKGAGNQAPTLSLEENPDILRWLAQEASNRPLRVIGFAAETEAVAEHGREKRHAKGCDWLLANDVSGGKIFGQDETALYFITDAPEPERWQGAKTEIATKLVAKLVEDFSPEQEKAA